MKRRLLCSKLRIVLRPGLENKAFPIGFGFAVGCDRSVKPGIEA
jgi:hypothetical protein